MLQKRHLLLQVHILESPDGLYFQSEGTSEIPLRVVDKQYENQWMDMVEDEVHQKFSVSLDPLCRLTVLRSCERNSISEIIVTFHHSICDALSIMNFIERLLSYCQQIEGGEHIEVITMKALPPLEELLISSSIAKKGLISKLKQASWLFQLVGPFKKAKLIIERQAYQSERHTHFLPTSLNKEVLINLKKRCKEEKTTVHGALCAAMLFGAAKTAHADMPIHLSCGSTISLRKYCEPEVTEDYMACIADGTGHTYTLKKDTYFWDLARESKSRISHSIQNGEMFMNFSNSGKSNQSESMKKQWETRMGRFFTVMIANVGQMTFSGQYGKFQLKEIYGVQAVHNIGPCFGLNVVTLCEQMFCGFNYVTPLVSTKTAKFFVDYFVNTIHTACMPQSSTLSFFDETEKASVYQLEKTAGSGKDVGI